MLIFIKCINDQYQARPSTHFYHLLSSYFGFDPKIKYENTSVSMEVLISEKWDVCWSKTDSMLTLSWALAVQTHSLCSLSAGPQSS